MDSSSFASHSRKALYEVGHARTLREGEKNFSSKEKIDHVVLVTKGVTGRAIGLNQR